MAYSNITSYFKELLTNVTQYNGVIINEYVIERYVRFRDTMDKATQHLVGEYLQTYAAGRAIERFYSQYYEEYDNVEHNLAPKVQSFVSNLFD